MDTNGNGSRHTPTALLTTRYWVVLLPGRYSVCYYYVVITSKYCNWKIPNTTLVVYIVGTYFRYKMVLAVAAGVSEPPPRGQVMRKERKIRKGKCKTCGQTTRRPLGTSTKPPPNWSTRVALLLSFSMLLFGFCPLPCLAFPSCLPSLRERATAAVWGWSHVIIPVHIRYLST